MFTKKLEDQFSADLLNTVRGVLGEAKKCSKDCKCEKCEAEDDDEAEEMKEGKTGLWANIHAKRKRIKAGSGERMRKPGSKGAPTDADFRAASEEVEIDLDESKILDAHFEKQTPKVQGHLNALLRRGHSYPEAVKKVKDATPLGENLTGLPKSTAEKNKQYIEITHQLGHKRRVPVHPTNAYKALNRYRNDPMTKSARIVSEETKKDSDAPFEGPYRKAGERKDRYGNVVKNVAKHLAKKAMMANEEVDLEEGQGRNSGGTTVGGGYYVHNGSARGAKKFKTLASAKAHAEKHGGNVSSEESFHSMLQKEEAGQIDELSKKTLGNYAYRAASELGSRGITTGLKIAADEPTEKNFKKMGNRQKGIAAAVKRLTKEEQDFIDSLNDIDLEQIVELEEGRGRPPKEGSAAWHAKQKQDNDDMPALGAQLRKAKSMNKKVRFMDGKEHEIHPNHADRFEDHMAARKTSQEKMAFQKQAHKSHSEFVKAVTASVPKSTKDTGEIVKYRH